MTVLWHLSVHAMLASVCLGLAIIIGMRRNSLHADAHSFAARVAAQAWYWERTYRMQAYD